MLNMREAVLKKGSADTYIMETFTEVSPYITYAQQGSADGAPEEEHELTVMS